MEPTWTRLREVFDAAVSLPEEEQAAYLEQACEGDAGLQAQVHALLVSEREAPAFLEQPTLGQPTTLDSGVHAGMTVGRYKLLELIGEGGFGSVFMAEQTEPVIRKVALKVIKLGMDTKQVIARFEAERQALAMMDHPNIAKVLDAGATDAGRPYFVMELVRGVPITEYCDTNSLSPRDRLDLFLQVCRGVQHAHTKGVIHRDIKPTNVLVTLHDGVPIPKIIDFGIAKATNARLTELTLFTEFRQFLGTPAYMSPEQAEMSGLDVDTRTDIYSLGALLYELLAGVTPFDAERLRAAGYDEIRRIIREEEPPRPSTRLSRQTSIAPSSSENASTIDVARHRRTDPSSLSRFIGGDLDWIIMRSLEKDRSRRYETANGLSADIERFLSDEPVHARPPSRADRLRKLVRRNRAAVSAGSIIALVLLLAAAVSIAFGLSEAKHRRIAQEALDAEEVRSAELEQVASFQGEMLQSVDPDQMGQRLRADILAEIRTAQERANVAPELIDEQIALAEELLIRANMTNVAANVVDTAIVDVSLATIRERFAEQPLVQASLLQTVCEVYDGLGKSDSALAPMIESLDIRRRTQGDDHPETLAAIERMVDLYGSLRQWEKSEKLCDELYVRCRAVLSEDHPLRLGALRRKAQVFERYRQFVDAERLVREELKIVQRLHGNGHPETEGPLTLLAQVLRAQGKLDEAEPFAAKAIELMRKRAEETTGRDQFGVLFDLGYWLEQFDKDDDAELYYRKALEISRQTLGDLHPATLATLNNIALALLSERRFEEAELLLREAFDGVLILLGEDNLDTLTVESNLGSCLREMDRFDEAEMLLNDVLTRRSRIQGDDHADTLFQANRLAQLLLDMEEFEAVETLLREALLHAERVLGDSHEVTNNSRLYLGKSLTQLGRHAEADGQLLACETFARNGDRWTARWGRSWREAMIDLYEAWHLAEPGAGHDADAALWRARLEELREAKSSPENGPGGSG